MRWKIFLFVNSFFIKPSTSITNFRKFSSFGGMELQEVVKVLEKYAPKKLAADWDNVGLLLEPSNHVVNKIMLTNDLTIKVN